MPAETARENQETISAVLGRTPSGVFVLTASDGNGRETGMLASWVQQAAFDPPMVSIAVNQQRYLNQWIQANPKLALCLVGESQGAFLKHFGKGFPPGEAAFTNLEIQRGVTGLPLLGGALGYLEGRVTGQIPAGDHIVYLLEIEAAGSGAALSAQRPMVHIRKNGFNY
jgi:flavin reductase (DIM6/NTAB) family NADH-FMN oxidoreductase RutF